MKTRGNVVSCLNRGTLGLFFCSPRLQQASLQSTPRFSMKEASTATDANAWFRRSFIVLLLLVRTNMCTSLRSGQVRRPRRSRTCRRHLGRRPLRLRRRHRATRSAALATRRPTACTWPPGRFSRLQGGRSTASRTLRTRTRPMTASCSCMRDSASATAGASLVEGVIATARPAAAIPLRRRTPTCCRAPASGSRGRQA